MVYSIYLIVSCSSSVSQRLCKRCSFFFFFVLLLLNESPLLKITAALVCLFVCLSFLMLVYLCVCVRVLKERYVCFIVVVPPPPFFSTSFQGLFLLNCLWFLLLALHAFCFRFFFLPFLTQKGQLFLFGYCVCACVCLLLLFATRRFEISQRLFFSPLSSLSLSLSLALPHFHFFFHFVFFLLQCKSTKCC